MSQAGAVSYDLRRHSLLCVHQTCCGGFKPSKVQFSYSFVDDDDARETIDDFWQQLLKQVDRLEGLLRV
ncbi:MAG: hypothetical protein V7735_24960 [Photobacterium frigidiphilum]|uniref:hypothetical protein n=1 Tax=Photobacterium frigidiphilum TaxID=264736 RepID=UPI003003594E